MSSPSNSVIYDGFDFSAYGIVFTNIDHLTLPTRNNQIEQRANRSGGVLVQSLLGTKPITLEGYYSGTSPADAQAMYDILAAALNRQARPLIVPHAGGTRTYTATPDNLIIQQPDGLNRLTFSFQFVVPDGNSNETSAITIVDQTITAPTATLPFVIDGSIKARPLITLDFTSVTDGTGKTVSIRNARDLVGLTFARDFITGDSIIIDSANFQIYINGVLTEPDGRMPTWEQGNGSLYYADTFSDRSVDINATYKKGNI